MQEISHKCIHKIRHHPLLSSFLATPLQLPAALPIVDVECFTDSLDLQFQKLIFYLSIFQVHNSICNNIMTAQQSRMQCNIGNKMVNVSQSVVLHATSSTYTYIQQEQRNTILFIYEFMKYQMHTCCRNHFTENVREERGRQ